MVTEKFVSLLTTSSPSMSKPRGFSIVSLVLEVLPSSALMGGTWMGSASSLSSSSSYQNSPISSLTKIRPPIILPAMRGEYISSYTALSCGCRATLGAPNRPSPCMMTSNVMTLSRGLTIVMSAATAVRAFARRATVFSAGGFSALTSNVYHMYSCEGEMKVIDPVKFPPRGIMTLSSYSASLSASTLSSSDPLTPCMSHSTR
mmetsp:Transcript_18038/g.41753  ORF Transcript_18038/g.41753 Transcript_18038/m.41753 type:complete len:203 (-) Transcript_18038:469-1077(-)